MNLRDKHSCRAARGPLSQRGPLANTLLPHPVPLLFLLRLDVINNNKNKNTMHKGTPTFSVAALPICSYCHDATACNG